LTPRVNGLAKSPLAFLALGATEINDE